MWVEILSISSVLMGLYILFLFFQTPSNPFSPPSSYQYHLGCYSENNKIYYSSSIKKFIQKIDSQNQVYSTNREPFSLQKRVKVNEISKGVAKDFERFLHEYYQIKTKSVYEQNYYNSLNIAEQKFKICKKEMQMKFLKQNCENSWRNYLISQNKYKTLKNNLIEKIERKQRQQQQISYLIFDNNYADEEQYEMNITNQITDLNHHLEALNNKKIDLLTRRAYFEELIQTNRSKLGSSISLLDQCLNNMKIINFCNELNEQLKQIKITFTKQDLQKKVQRKLLIIDTHLNAIRNAEKLQDLELLEFNKKNLAQNQEELKLLQERIQDFKSFEESYCSKCSEDKINSLKIEVQETKKLISQFSSQITQTVKDQQKIASDIITATQKIHQIQEQREFHINSRICLSEQCKNKRSDDLKQYGRTLNELKKDVLDYKFELQEHKLAHANKLKDLNEWIYQVNEVISCLNSKKYFESLRDNRPEHNQNEVLKIQNVKGKLIQQLENLSQF